MDKKKTVPNHEIDICDDKGEVNIHIRLKIDWENKRYWLKHIKLDHVDLTRKENQ